MFDNDATISVLPHRFTTPVFPPRGGATFDWRHPPGTPQNVCGVRAYAVVTRWTEALAHRYEEDAVGVAYVLRDAAGDVVDPHPCVTQASLAWLRREGFAVECRVMHADLGAATTDDVQRVWARSPAGSGPLDGAVWCPTARGRTCVFRPLPTAVAPAPFEEALAAWHAELAAVGLHADRTCCDWTYQFRMPRAFR